MRKFLETEPNFPVAKEALDIIDGLFAVETEAAEHSELPLGLPHTFAEGIRQCINKPRSGCNWLFWN